MSKHRNSQSTVPNNPPASNFSPADALERLYVELIEVEALAYAAGEAVAELRTASHQRRINNRLYTLVTKTAGAATTALSLDERLVSALSAHMARVSSTKRELEGRAQAFRDRKARGVVGHLRRHLGPFGRIGVVLVVDERAIGAPREQ